MGGWGGVFDTLAPLLVETGLMFRSFRTRIGRNFLSITKLLFITSIYYPVFVSSVPFSSVLRISFFTCIETTIILVARCESNFSSRENEKVGLYDEDEEKPILQIFLESQFNRSVIEVYFGQMENLIIIFHGSMI